MTIKKLRIARIGKASPKKASGQKSSGLIYTHRYARRRETAIIQFNRSNVFIAAFFKPQKMCNYLNYKTANEKEDILVEIL